MKEYYRCNKCEEWVHLHELRIDIITDDKGNPDLVPICIDCQTDNDIVRNGGSYMNPNIFRSDNEQA